MVPFSRSSSLGHPQDPDPQGLSCSRHVRGNRASRYRPTPHASLHAIFAEQASYDAGGLCMAHLITGLEDPPFAMTEMHKVPNSLHAHGQLSDPRWVATNLAYLRDLEGITEKSNKYVWPGTPKTLDGTPGDDAAAKKKPFRPKRGAKKDSRGSGRQRPLKFSHLLDARRNADELHAEVAESRKATLPEFVSSVSFGVDLILIFLIVALP